MNKVVKYILQSLLAIVITGCIVVSYIAGVEARRPLLCKGVRIEVLDSAENSFVSATDVRRFIDRSYGNIIGEPLDSIDLTKVEHIVDSRSAVRKCQAYVTRDSMLNVKVTQRKPVVRFQKKDGGFYADADGYIFPLQNSYASHVQVIDGNIPLAANSGYKGELKDDSEREWFEGVMNLVNFLESEKKWKGKIVQIHVDSKGDLILIPREGNERFILGKAADIEDKFSRMEKYYTVIIPEKGSSAYRHVDLRFKGQIICK